MFLWGNLAGTQSNGHNRTIDYQTSRTAAQVYQVTSNEEVIIRINRSEASIKEVLSVAAESASADQRAL
jgi:hypothetical protein